MPSASGAGGSAARPFGRLLIVAAVVTVAGWSGLVYRSLAAMAYASASADEVRAGRVAPAYDLATLPWARADARTLAVHEGRLDLITGDGPFLYNAIANVPTGGAAVAHLAIHGRVAHGGLTVGLIANGRWLANRAVVDERPFDALLTARIADTPNVAVVIANNNGAGTSTAEIGGVTLYLVR